MRLLVSAALAVTVFAHSSFALSTTRSNTGVRPVERVAIIGSGIAGLASAHALSSLLPDVDISVFDSRPGLDPLVGAGIQLNGGLKVLGDINPRVQQAVIQAGLPLERIRSQTRISDNSNEKALDTLLDLNLQDTVRKSGATGLLQSDGTVLWTSIMRGTLQQTLYDTLGKRLQQKIRFQKTLTNLLVGQDQHVYCTFSDGSKAGPFDLVIGCDGVKSAVKEYVTRNIISKEFSQRDGSTTGLYTGLRIRYAVQLNAAKKDLSNSPVTFSQYFGNGCYCLDGTYGASKSITKSVFAIFLDKNYFGPFRMRKGSRATNENVDWSQDKVQAKIRARQVMIQQLKDANVAQDELIQVIERADRFFELGVYAHNPFCRWSKEISGSNGACAVLCGDAAHALPPFLGQGSNQAIQDAYSLATRIRSYNDAVAQHDGAKVSLLSYLKVYESVRWMPNFQIFWKASFIGYLETGGFDGFYSTFRNVFFKTMATIGVAQKVLMSAASPKV
jgi:salicylate hydroxylase